jgi:peptidyl-prolyl cis-trans isomerase C
MRAVTAGALSTVLLLAAAATAQEPAGRALARVRGVEITAGDLERRLALLGRERPVPPERHPEVLRLLIREEVLLQAAAAQGLAAEPGVRERLELARRQVLIDEVLKRRLAAAAQVTEEDLQRAYRENLPRFISETVQVRHIMVPTEAEAEAIRRELAAGKDFADLARTRSRDEGSAEKGGDLGALAQGQTDAGFEAVAFRLKDGELSEVVQTEHGFHVLKGGPRGSTLRPFEEVREEVRQLLAQERQQETLQRVLAELEQSAAPEILDDRLK